MGKLKTLLIWKTGECRAKLSEIWDKMAVV